MTDLRHYDVIVSPAITEKSTMKIISLAPEVL